MNKEKIDAILNILEYITPDTSWYGESNRDRESIQNIGALEDMIIQLSDRLTDGMEVGITNKGNASAEAITRKKYEAVRELYDYFADVKCAIEMGYEEQERQERERQKNGGKKR